ncbi:MAG TPA: hypothetical protein VGY32_13080 [Solirubrobacteraceae bacterium]|jgi:hypothetical protein|nr:hypothetical protein [Solirubrobacteraceae bacterium]
MLASITPLGERARGANWYTTTAIYTFGSVLGGAAIGTLAGLLGSVVLAGVGTDNRLAIVAFALTAGFAWELVRVSVPGPRRQVNEQWLHRYRSWVYGLGFGTQLGAGVATVVVSSAVYAVVLSAFAAGQPETGAAIGALAAALRGATVLLTARVVSPQRLLAFHERMRVLARPVRSGALVAQLALGGLAALAVVA